MYERYCKIRDGLGYKDAYVAQMTGITKSTFTDWKSGRSTPKREKLIKIAECLGVSLDYLLTGTDASAPEWYSDPEAAAEAQRVFTDPDLKILFDAAKDAKPENIRLAAEMLKRFKETNSGG